MKKFILYSLPLLIAVCLTGCVGEVVVPDDNNGSEECVYTLQLAIGETPATRSLTSEAVGLNFKTRWCYGDKVTLYVSGSNVRYVFSIATPSGKNEGDPVETPVATFKYTGSISNFNNFKGYIEYNCGKDANTVISTGWTHENNLNLTSYVEIKSKPYALQASNDNAEHLNCLANLYEYLNGVDLSETKVITLRSKLSILKIVLDDIYYPIFGGAILCVDGLKDPKRSDSEAHTVGMVLGTGIVGTASDSRYYNVQSLRSQSTDKQDPIEDHGIVPFYDVPSEKDPLTGYAKRDEDHKLVAYLPIFEDREVRNGEAISICLRDSWSMDSYFWQVDSLKPFKLPLGSLYTIDLTKKAGNRYLYESKATISMGPHFADGFGALSAKNIGAKTVTDQGNFYMFGQDKPISPGGHYPGYPGTTSYYYYKEGYIYYYKQGLSANSFRVAAASKLYHTNISLPLPGGESKTMLNWWRDWVKDFVYWPSFGMELGWKPIKRLRDENFRDPEKYITYTSNVPIERDGVVIGIKFSCWRTGHSVFVPVTDILEPSKLNEGSHFIEPGAIASVKKTTEKMVHFLGEAINITSAPDAIKYHVYTFKIGVGNTITTETNEYDLNLALPIRPAFYETGSLAGFRVGIPGAL